MGHEHGRYLTVNVKVDSSLSCQNPCNNYRFIVLVVQSVSSQGFYGH